MRRHINAALYQKPVVDIPLFGKIYQGIIREKKKGPITMCRIQILGISDLTDHELSALRTELQPVYKKYRPFCIQLGIQEILCAAPTAMLHDSAYIKSCVDLRNGYVTHMRTYGLRPAHKENMPPATYIIDLQKMPSDLLASCSSHHRTKIKKAQKAGITVSIASTPGEYDAFYQLLASTGSLKGFGVISSTWYTTLVERIESSHSGYLYLAYHENHIVGGALYLIDTVEHEALYLYGATDRTIGNLGASQLLHREAILDLQGKGIQHVDLFGGGPTGQPDHHLSHVGQLKEGFGSQKVELAGSYDLVYKPFRYGLWKLLR